MFARLTAARCLCNAYTIFCATRTTHDLGAKLLSGSAHVLHENRRGFAEKDIRIRTAELIGRLQLVLNFREKRFPVFFFFFILKNEMLERPLLRRAVQIASITFRTHKDGRTYIITFKIFRRLFRDWVEGGGEYAVTFACLDLRGARLGRIINSYCLVRLTFASLSLSWQ